MPSLLVIVFVVQLLIHLVNTVGASTVNSIVSRPVDNDHCSIHANIRLSAMEPLRSSPNTDIAKFSRATEAQDRIHESAHRDERHEQSRQFRKVGKIAQAT